jgi:hypothetical protein
MWNGRGGEMACSSEESLVEREVRGTQVKLGKRIWPVELTTRLDIELGDLKRSPESENI